MDNNKYLAEINLNKAINLYLDEDKFTKVAKNYEKLAEIHLSDNRSSEAIFDYENSYKYYEYGGHMLAGISCLTKAAYLRIDLGSYEIAINYLQKASVYYSSNILMISNSKILNFEISILKIYYKFRDYSLIKYDHRHYDYIFLQSLISAIVNNDVNLFDTVVNQYHSNHELNEWQLRLLKRILCDVIYINNK